MTLIKRDLFPAIPGLIEDFFNRELLELGARNFSITNTTIPRVNIVESNDDFVVEMAAPGMSKKDFRIELDNEILTISSEKETSNELKEGNHFARQEFSYQSFQRSFHLPKSVVEESKIKAKYEDGVLRVMIPKKEEAKALPARKIQVS
jgi:HSP20 family protein